MPLQFNPFTGTFDVTTKGDTGAVAAAGDGSAAAPGITFASDTNTGIYRPGADQLALSTNGNGRLFIDSSGNVGIGATVPTATLHVRAPNSDTITPLLRLEQFNAAETDGARLVIQADAANNAVSYQSTGTNSGAHVFLTGSTERLRIDSSGRLLVGTSSASGANLLQVNSDALIYGITVGRGAGAISSNTATGGGALQANTTGYYNTANGVNALFYNTTGHSNTANGRNALLSNTTGVLNTANGVQALLSNTTGVNNTANGCVALFSNTTGNSNTANGVNALYNNTTGVNNAANGVQALFSNTTGNYNTANGVNALYNNTTGSGNIGVGGLTSGGSNSPVFSTTTESDRIVMGSTAVTNAYVQVAWTVVSDARDKTNFAPVPHGLDFVNALKPTAYQFKYDRDSTETNGPVRYGFLAQDVLALEGQNSVIIDAEDPEKLRYNGESLVPVLVNAIQELTAIVKDLQTELSILKGAKA